MKKKINKSNIWKIFPYLKEFSSRISFAILLVIASKLLSVADPYVMKKLIDILVEKGTEAPLKTLVLLVVLFFALRWGGNLFDGAKDYIFTKVQATVKKKISLDMFKHLLALPAKFHAGRSTGKISRKITRGSSALETIFWFLSFNIVPTLMEVLFVAIIFMKLFPISFTITFLLFVAAYITFTVFVTERRQKLLLETNKKDDRANGQSIDALLNYETVKYFSNEKYEYKRFGKFLDDWATPFIKATKSGANLNMGQGLIITAGLTAILVLAIGEYLKGQATIGDFVLVTTYLTRIAIPMGFLGFTYRAIKEGLADVDEMFKLLQVENKIIDKPDAKELKVCGGRINFKNVSFGYSKDRMVIDNVSLEIKPKERVALVGYSGSGKSTISKLLFRLYDVNDGQIMIDGNDIRNLKQESLRNCIGIVAQDSTLFNDTVMYNISYGKPGASEEDVFRAAKMANIHDFISKELPEGYKTIVGERGVKLSGGEKQRIAIARMLIKKPSFLVFDEATASLDTKSEKIIQEEIKKLSKGNITTIVIAHRLSTIVDFDKIVVLKSGRIVEEGKHEELLRKKGIYFGLWQAQSKGTEKM